jgi:hypothetical protein
MRHAAYAAGLTKKVDDPDLMLALEPEAAVLASIADCAPSERARFVKGTRLMIVDCGGAWPAHKPWLAVWLVGWLAGTSGWLPKRG